MNPDDKAKRLRIYISSTDKFKHSPLYEVIVFAAKRYGIAGATVLKGIMSFGVSSEVYSNKLWEISEKVPLIVEIIDEPGKIDSFFESRFNSFNSKSIVWSLLFTLLRSLIFRE